MNEDGSDNDSERSFNSKKWGTVTNDQVNKLYEEEWKKFFDPRENCAACLFMKNNIKVKEMINLDYNKIKTSKDLSNNTEIDHINFP